MPRKVRRQRITLRFKRREQLKRHFRSVIVRSVVLALVIGFGAGLVTGGDTFVSRFIREPAPDRVHPKPAHRLAKILKHLPEQRRRHTRHHDLHKV